MYRVISECVQKAFLDVLKRTRNGRMDCRKHGVDVYEVMRFDDEEL